MTRTKRWLSTLNYLRTSKATEMGKTYKHQGSRFEEDRPGLHKKPPRHANNRKQGGMRILNDHQDEDDDYFDDDVDIADDITLNIQRGPSR